MRTCLPSGEVTLIRIRTVAAPAATAKLLIGPTTEVKMSSSTGLAKFCGFTGVGFAQPIIGIFEIAATSGNNTVPTGSMCFSGFSVIRPNMRAVGSPRKFAIHACADSCTLIANRNAMIWKTISTYSSFIPAWHRYYHARIHYLPDNNLRHEMRTEKRAQEIGK